MKHASCLALSVVLAGLLEARPAAACGVSAAGVASCSLEEHEEAERPRWALGVSGVYTSTALRFTGSVRADQLRYGTLASLAYMPAPRWVFQVGAGPSFGGSLALADGKHRFSAGPLVALGAAWRALRDERYFLLLTSQLSLSAARTRLEQQPSAAYEALDVRLGAEAGVELAQVFRPYAAARVFGGPVFWRYQGRSVTGTDTHHYQLGAGLGVQLSRRFQLQAEGIPLGERAVSLSASATF
jgi:hypothetical protein